MITLTLSEDDAILFRAFREHQDNFTILLASGLFNVRSGKAVISTNVEGQIDAVDVNVPTFRRGHKQIQFLLAK